MKPGPRNLITDVPGLRVGNAQDDALKSGTTVLLADDPFTASVHVMGGAPGTRETDLLAPDKSVAAVDALVLSGGSAYGLDACSGVVDGLRAAGRGFRLGGRAATPPSPSPTPSRCATCRASRSASVGCRPTSGRRSSRDSPRRSRRRTCSPSC